MLELFQREPETDNRRLEDTAYVNILPKMKHELATTIRIHKKRKRAAATSDLIVKLLKAVVMGKSNNVEDYVRKNTEYLKNAARVAGFTSMQNKGKVFQDLYMNNEQAMFIYITELEKFSSLEDWKADWKNICPVSVHYTSCSDLSMNLPTDYENVLEVFSLYSLNIPMLLVQYREYTIQRAVYGLEVNVAKFVVEYVYASMLPQLYDHALANRYFGIMDNELLEEFEPNFPGMPANHGKVYDKLTKKVVKSRNKGYTFTRYLNTAITTTPSTIGIYKLPDMYLNQFVMSAFYFGTSDIIRKLITTAGPKTLKLEKKKIQKYVLFLKAVSTNSMIMKVYPHEVKRMIDMNTDEILETIKGLK